MSLLKFILKVNKTTVKGVAYPRIQFTKYLTEIGFKPGDEVIVLVDKKNEVITIRRK